MSVSLSTFTIEQLESVRFWLNGVFILANVAVWAGVFMEREKFSEHIQDWGWRVLIAGLAFETLCASALWQVDTTISSRQEAAIIALGNDTEGVEGYVQSKIRGLRTQMGAFRISVAQQEARNQAAIDDLIHKTVDLNKARADALAAAKKSQNDLTALDDALARQRALTSKIEAATEKLEQRHITKFQARQLRNLLAKWAIVPGAGEFSGRTPLGGKQVAVVVQYPDTKEAAIFADELRNALKSAGWNACCDGWGGVPEEIGGEPVPALTGITVASTESRRATEVADALVSALNRVGQKTRKYDHMDGLPNGCDKAPSLAEKLPGCAMVYVIVGEHP